MRTTRSASRKSAESQSPQSSAGNKRKAESSPAASPAAKSKKAKTPKKQKTIEETLPENQDDKDKPEETSQDTEMKDAVPEESATSGSNGATDQKIAEDKKDEKSTSDPEVKDVKPNGEKSEESSAQVAKTEDTTAAKEPGVTNNQETASSSADQTSNTQADADHQDKATKKTSNEQDDQQNLNETKAAAGETNGDDHKQDATTATGDAIEESSQREKSTPSSILEKGIIYFFFRGRVGIDNPSEVDDIARSYIVLRPLPRGAKITDGTLGDAKNLRVLAVPKKVLPQGPKDRFMVFVEKSGADLDELKKEFLSSSDYDTKTAGTRHTPAATPIGEGVYALTSTGRETHLAYVLTIPQELSEVQKDIGLEAKGSWVTSVKNPQHKGPSNAQLPQDPAFTQEILDEFRSLRWGQLQPKHLDYENCQLLLIGHKDHSFAKATETDDKEADPKEELEKLGEEDDRRIEHLEGNDTVFEDLNIDAKEYPSVQTTW